MLRPVVRPLSPSMGVMLLQLVMWLQIMTAMVTHSTVSGLDITLSNKEGFERAHSCRHSVARIEITNTDDHDCLIRSIQLGPETTVQVEPSPILNSETVLELPQQFYAADVDERSLTLSPGQVAAMPLPLLPRFPPRWESAADALPSHLSVWQRSDREEWLGPYALRSNLHLAKVGASPTLEEYRITSTLLVESETHGIQSMSVEANSVRDNPFGLPDSIYFHGDAEESWADPTTAISEAPNFRSEGGIRTVGRIWNVYDKALSPNPSDCYDIYVRHPGEEGGLDPREPWLIWSVVVSSPEKSSLYLSPEHFGSLGHSMDSARHVIDNWGEDSHRVIQPDGEPHYLVTVCPTPATEKNLRAEEKVKKNYNHWITSTQSNDSLGFVIIQSDAPVLMAELIGKRPNATETEAESLFRKLDLPSENETGIGTTTVLQSTVEKIVMHCLPFSGAAARNATVRLHNAASQRATVMSVSLVFRDSSSQKMKKMGVQFQLHPVLSGGSWHIGAQETRDIALVSMTVDANITKIPRGAFSTTGRLLVQGSLAYSDRDAWLRHVRANPLLDTDSLVEIPFSIHISDGKIGFQLSDPTNGNERFLATSEGPGGITEVDAAFFPLSTYAPFAPEGDAARENNESPQSIDQYLKVFSTVPDSSFTLRTARIIDEYSMSVELTSKSGCRLLGVSLSHAWAYASNDEDVAGASSIGEVHLGYMFSEASIIDAGDLDSPVLCHVVVETEPDTGEHMLPIGLYSGSLIASDLESLDATSGEFAESLIAGTSRGRVRSGPSEVENWLNDSPDGKSFDSFLRNKGAYSKGALRGRFRAILEDDHRTASSVYPILLAAGTMNAGETEIFPLYLMNPNPIPVTVSLGGTNIDGFSVRLGRDKIVSAGEGKSLSETIMRTWTKTKESLGQNSTKQTVERIRGQRLESLFHFLKTSKIPRGFLDEFIYRDAIYTDHKTAALFGRTDLRGNTILTATFHKNAWQTDSSALHCCSQASDVDISRNVVGPGLLTTGTGKFVKLCRCTGTRAPLSTTIPPSGMARFDVTVTAPSEEMLERDINSFVSTGMVMSTDQGVEMPLLTSFDVPRGNLVLSGFSKERKQGGTGSPQMFSIDAIGAYFQSNHLPSASEIMIPSRSRSQLKFDSLLGQEGLSLDSRSEELGEAVYARSSFNQDVQLVKIESCNSWFHLDLSQNANESNFDAFLGVNIGSLRLEVPCSNPNTLPEFSSFHACVLNWISKWQELQKSGCGTNGVEGNAQGILHGRHRRLLTEAHARMLQLSAWSFSGHRGLFENATSSVESRRYFDGYLAPSVVTLAADIWNWWRRVHNWDLFTMSTDIWAKVMWNSSDEGPTQHVSLPIRNVTVISKLVPPSLLDSERARVEPPAVPFGASTLEFPPALVGTPTAIMIPLYNPTNVTVIVRLAVVLPEEVEDEEEDDFFVDQNTRNEYISSAHPPYVQGPLYAELGLDQVNQQWWDGPGSFFFSNVNGDLIRAHHNVSVRAGSHAYVGLVSPSLLSNSAFLYGCAQRCGIRDEPAKNDAARKTQQKTLIGAAAASGAVLAGRGRGEFAEDNIPVEPFDDMRFPAGSSIHSDGLGPTAFGIPRPALKEILIEPYSTSQVGPIYFRPPGRSPRMGTTAAHSCEDCDAFETQIFIENSLTGVERVALKGRALWEKVEFSDFTSSEGDETVSDVDLRNGMTTLMFPGTLLPPFPTSSSVRKEIILKNIGDTPVSFSRAYLSDGITPRESKNSNSSCVLADFQLLNCSLDGTFLPFRFGPGETASLFVSHRPKCTQKSDYISLKVDYDVDDEVDDAEERRHTKNSAWRAMRANQRKWSFRKASETLVIGYNMNPEIFSDCVPTNTDLFQPLPGLPLLLTPVNQTIGLRDLSGKVKYLSSSKVHSPMLNIIWFVFYLGLYLFVVTGMVYMCLSRRVAVDALEKFSGYRYVRQGSSRKPESLVRASSRELTQAEFELMSQEHVGRTMLLRPAGKLMPQCVTKTGTFQRDRSRINASPSSLAVSKDRSRTMSEALFRRIANDQLHGGVVPLNLGWKAALSKGIINERSFRKIQGNLKTHQLLVLRSRQPKPPAQHLANKVGTEHNIQERDFGVDKTGENSGHSKSEIGFESPDAELASEASDVELSVVETSPNGSSEHESADLSRQSDSPEIESFNIENDDTQNEARDFGFKTIRAEKSGKGLSRKKGLKKPSSGSKGKNGSNKKERKPRSPTRKSSTEEKSEETDKTTPALTPASHHIPETATPRGWAQVAASSNSPGVVDGSSPLRPPPGLGPPPGFGSHLPVSPDALSTPPHQNEGFALDFSGGFGESRPVERYHLSSGQSETSSNSGEHMQITNSPVMAPSYLSRDNSMDQLPSLNMFLGDTLPGVPDEEPETQDEFDVLDFLDGILNDGSTHDGAGAAPTEEFPSSITATLSATPVGLSAEPVVPANPWAAGGGSEDSIASSRATLYGIALNETRAPQETMGLPLLTPQVLLEAEPEEDEMRRSPLFARTHKHQE